MSKGREPLYLKPGMDEAELFQQFNARSPYYRHIASSLVFQAHGRQLGLPRDPHWSHGIDLYARSGYCARAMYSLCTAVTAIEKRPSFVNALHEELAPEMFVDIQPEEPTSDKDVRHAKALILCCEQGAQLLHGDFSRWMRRIQTWCGSGSVFGMSLGPSNHPFKEFPINNHRVGENDSAKLMTELSHPIAQAVHSEIVRMLKGELGYDKETIWPEAKLTDPEKIEDICVLEGWPFFEIVEEKFRVPGHHIHLYQQNAWTMYFRFWTEEQYSTEKRIDLIMRAITAVRARPEYDAWCAIDAYHPVAFYIATRR